MISVNVYRKVANQFANDLTSNENVSTILEDTTEGWSSLSSKLKHVADRTPDGVYGPSTILGTNESFVEPFREALDVYKSMYSVMDWCHEVGGRLVTMEDDPMNQKPHRQDVSFAEKMELSDDTKIIAIGDIHSGIHTFLEIMDSLYEKGVLKDDFGLSRGYHLVFLGDLVDRGAHGLDILHLVFRLKTRNFQSVHIINGNHEDHGTYTHYGFKDELESQLTNPVDQNLVHNLLTFLPAVLFLKLGEKWLQFNHGGISEYEPLQFLESDYDLEFHGVDEPLNLKYMGLRWNDFNANIDGTVLSTSRGQGNTRVLEYGSDATEEYLERNYIEGIVRGHQDFMSIGIIPRVVASLRDMTYNPKDGMVQPNEFHWVERVGKEENWEHLSLADAFRDYSVFTTSTAVKNKGVTHHTYLEICDTSKEIKNYQRIIRSNIQIYSEYARKHDVEDEFMHLVYDALTMSKHKTTDEDKWDRFVLKMKFNFNNGTFPILVLNSIGSVI